MPLWFTNLNPVTQALVATLFTWGVTALGAAVVFVFTTVNRKLLDAMLGFAAGIMIAASFCSISRWPGKAAWSCSEIVLTYGVLAVNGSVTPACRSDSDSRKIATQRGR